MSEWERLQIAEGKESSPVEVLLSGVDGRRGDDGDPDRPGRVPEGREPERPCPGVPGREEGEERSGTSDSDSFPAAEGEAQREFNGGMHPKETDRPTTATPTLDDEEAAWSAHKQKYEQVFSADFRLWRTGERSQA
ncbi:hypothetical protein AAFF_G00317710 [Aldrovandia affinis]|uniref:Uncharacterized protein n=1 Tax=Aldrovandia affinis TaxID=143900 RepID=A0AAD7R7N7_9TELE|nr:hypothetical protein AAFF_G00317710 [Aldrovandia affinis]